MATLEIDFTFTQKDMASLNKRLEALVKRSSDLSPFFDDASAYMVNVVKNRIYRTKKGPDGAKWAPLSDTTIDIKGHSTILYDTGDLGKSIHVDSIDQSGFIIAADTGIAPYAAAMNSGVQRTGGFIKGKKIPARPFMGISDTNVKTLSSMLKKYVASGVRATGYGESSE